MIATASLTNNQGMSRQRMLSLLRLIFGNPEPCSAPARRSGAKAAKLVPSRFVN
jgi:hypothetical protein